MTGQDKRGKVALFCDSALSMYFRDSLYKKINNLPIQKQHG